MNKRKKWTYLEIKEYIESFKGYKLISTLDDIDEKYKYYCKNNLYIKKKVDVLIKCPICNNIYNVTFDGFYCGNRHNDCSRIIAIQNTRINFEEIKEQVESEGYKFKFPNQYETKDSMCTLICPNNHEWDTTIHNFNHYKCPYCNAERRLEEALNKLKEYLSSIKYTFIEYKFSNKSTCFTNGYVTYICNNGHKHKATVGSLYVGKRCVYCSTTKGEERIIKFLEENNIKYFYDKRYFKDLIGVGGARLKPDFIIEDRKVWIEYDGIGHFEPVDFAGKGKEWALEIFNILKTHDEIKNKYARKNNWKLIRIPYWDFDNIEKILKEIL